MPFTLDDYITEIITYTETQEDIQKENGVYSAEALNKVKIFISALNYAKGLIVKNKLAPDYAERITLDSTLLIDISTLKKTFNEVVEITNSYGRGMYFEYASMQQLYLRDMKEGHTVTIKYEYIPPDFSINDLKAVLDIPERVLDPRVLCFYATYFYLSQSTTAQDINKANRYLMLWNDAYESIKKPSGHQVVKTIWNSR